MSDSELEDLPVFDFPEDAVGRGNSADKPRNKAKARKVATNVKNWAKNKFKALKLMKKTSNQIPRPLLSSSRRLKHGRYPSEVEEAIAQQKLELRMKPPVYHEFTVHDYHESKAFQQAIMHSTPMNPSPILVNIMLVQRKLRDLQSAQSEDECEEPPPLRSKYSLEWAERYFAKEHYFPVVQHNWGLVGYRNQMGIGYIAMVPPTVIVRRF
ncbi:hypothetical protein BT69DRAFT_1315963 [Atractiella rhizophila]|nr:hypothetical protein BT69DRAFT_1315963 [Atractiella rhizophila]